MTRPEDDLGRSGLDRSGAHVAGGEAERTRQIDLTLSEERLVTGTETVETGRVRARKEVDVETVEQVVPRGVEHADLERTPVLEGDSGQVETLPDGSLSIPVFEEQIVIEKRLVVRERVVIRKHTVYEEHQVTAELRRERLEIETDGDVQMTGDVGQLGTGAGRADQPFTGQAGTGSATTGEREAETAPRV